MKGIVVWITGVPNSGKTRFSDRLASKIKSELRTICIQLDGDLLRQTLNRTLDDTNEDRELLGITYWELAKSLARQGHIVIVSAVAMYDSVFSHIIKDSQHKALVYLQCNESELLRRDANKGTKISATQTAFWQDQIIPNEFEKIVNETELQGEEGVKRILNVIKNLKSVSEREIQEYSLASEIVAQGRDRKRAINYWDNFYRSDIPHEEPSTFATSISNLGFLDNFQSILDLGCGNGRDSFYFARNGKRVVGVDASQEVIRKNLMVLNRESSVQKLLSFETLTDWENLRELLLRKQPDCIYARFFFHAIDESSEDEILRIFAETSQPGVAILAEMRTTADPLMRKGLKISATERVFGHYRRFIIPSNFLSKVENAGFQIMYKFESTGLSIRDSDNPSLLRIVASKL